MTSDDVSRIVDTILNHPRYTRPEPLPTQPVHVDVHMHQDLDPLLLEKIERILSSQQRMEEAMSQSFDTLAVKIDNLAASVDKAVAAMQNAPGGENPAAIQAASDKVDAAQAKLDAEILAFNSAPVVPSS